MIHHVKRSDFWRAVQDARDILAPVEAAMGEPVIELDRVQELAKAYTVQCDYGDDSTDEVDRIEAKYRRFTVTIQDAPEWDDVCFECIITALNGRMVNMCFGDNISELDDKARKIIDAMHLTVNARPGRVKK